MVEHIEHMTRALELARRGEGQVEPNPMVGCVIVREGERIGEGWHQRFGGPHAEVEALRSVKGSAAGATMYVTLEPCCHTGKTPPCTEALLAAGIKRVVVAQEDPFPAVSGQGIQQLRDAGVDVQVGVGADLARQITAPFCKLVQQQMPWVIAKWAMTLDGKLASRTGHSRWITNELSRARVHDLRRRVDAIMVGRGTAVLDDPLLTARPPGPRMCTRIVVDTAAKLPLQSQLVRTAHEQPVVVAVSEQADADQCSRLRDAGCEVLLCPGASAKDRLRALLLELGRRRMTNLLVEGGGVFLGSLFDAGWIDEVHVFVAPKLVGGLNAPSPISGTGWESIPEISSLSAPHIEVLDEDVYITGRLNRC